MLLIHIEFATVSILLAFIAALLALLGSPVTPTFILALMSPRRLAHGIRLHTDADAWTRAFQALHRQILFVVRRCAPSHSYQVKPMRRFEGFVSFLVHCASDVSFDVASSSELGYGRCHICNVACCVYYFYYVVAAPKSCASYNAPHRR